MKQYGKGEVAADAPFADVKAALHRECSHATDGTGNCLGFAARDASGHLSPFRFSRRPVGPDDVRLQITHW